MTPPEDQGSKDNKTPKAYTELGVSSAIIALANLFLKDATWKGAVTIFAPLIGYATDYLLRRYTKNQNFKKLCKSIDNMIKEYTEEARRPGLTKRQRTEIEKEIAELRKLKKDRTLKNLDIDIK